MAKFKLFWENNPDTPLSAERLSGFIDHYSTDSIIYSDDDLFLPNGDGNLKIRGLTKVNHLSHQTLAAFTFDQSLTSFNSKFAPKEQRDIIFRDEYYDKKGSVAFDESVTNILTNSGFENDGEDWVFFRGDGDPENDDENSDIDSTVEYTTEDFYPRLNQNNLKSAKITTGTQRGRSRLVKYISIPEELGVYSLSFYYKINNECYFAIKSETEENPQYYNDLSGWQGTERRYELEPTNEWKRFELPDITIGDQDNLRLEINVVEEESTYQFDSFLFEEKPYCSSYFYRDTESTILSYSKDVINYKKGFIDFTFYPKYRGDKNTFFSLKTQNSNNDALRLEYNGQENGFILKVFDARDSSYIDHYISMGYDTMINRWNRCIVNWNFDSRKIHFAVIKLPDSNESEEFSVIDSDIKTFTLPERNFLFDEEDIESFYIGSNAGSDPARSLIDFFKINKEDKLPDGILRELNLIYSKIDEPIFKMFESPYQSTIIDESLLDSGSFKSNTKYYLWLCDNEDDNSCDILVSQSPDSPEGYKWFDSTIIGGFHTVDDKAIDLTSFWDRSTFLTKNLHTDRILIGNTRTRTINDTTTESAETPIEFRSWPDRNATFNADSYFTKHIYGRNVNDDNFLDINNETGEVFLDDLHFDGHTIESLESDLEITAENPNTIDIHAKEVKLTSTGIDIKLDDLRVLNNQIYPQDGSNLIINTKKKGNNNLEIITDTFDVDSGIINIENTNNLSIDTGEDFSIHTGTDFVVTSSSVIKLDDLIIDDNLLYRDSNFRLRSIDSYVEIEDVKFDDNKIYYGDKTKRFITFYEDEADDTKENIDIVSDNLIKIDSPKFEVTSEEIYFHAEMANMFRLEDIRVENNKFFTIDTPLMLGGDGDELSNDVYIKSSNNIYLDSQTINLDATTINFNIGSTLTLDNIRINDNTIDSKSGQLNIGNTSEKIYIEGSSFELASGDVGIGSSNPKEKLDVDGSIRLDGDIGFGNDAKVIEYLDSNNQSGAGWSGKDAIKLYGDGDISNLALYVGHIHTLGASEIQGQLTVGDKVNVVGDLKFKAQDTGDIIFSNTDDSERAGIYSGSSDGDNILRLRTGGDTALYIDSSQNIGIKNSSPSTDFDVSGSGNFTHDLSVGDTLTVGDIDGSQSSFQSSSLQNNDGFIQTPWLYVSGGIEADERGSKGTGIFFRDGDFSSSTDTITFVTNGEKRMQVVSDGGIKIGNSGTLVNSSSSPSDGNWLTYNGDFQAYRVHNAVWNDLAECWNKDERYEFEYGMVVVQTESGIRPSQKRAEKGTVGILSNTYGYILGDKDFNEDNFMGSKSLPVAISGRVVANYVGKLEIGDEVVSTKDANLTRASFIEKIIKRDRIVGRVDEIIDNGRCKIKVY